MEEPNDPIEVFRARLRDTLLNGSSLNAESAELWTLENFKNLYKALNDNKKLGEESFLEKIRMQINEADSVVPDLSHNDKRNLVALLFEVVSLYYVFPSNISARTKLSAVKELVGEELDVNGEDFNVCLEAVKAGGVGSGGMGYNTNKLKEISYLIDVFTRWYELTCAEREKLISENGKKLTFQDFLDNVSDGRTPQSRHVLLYFLYPHYYEPIISTQQKQKITQIFSSFYSGDLLQEECGEATPSNLIDQKIKVISRKLQELRGRETNFYDVEIAAFWDSASAGVIPDLDTELLEYKKQVVLYGPPGTSKTYTAKELAKEIVRYRLAKDVGVSILTQSGQEKLTRAVENNIHRLQLHPAYSYEDFVRGLQFSDGSTLFKKGYLLKLLDLMQREPDVPHVLILDEINRVDLSRLFGECFSALENRGETIDLLGESEGDSIQLTIPDNLYVIGTMNLIDHSVEQLDFALRRRFLWVHATYNPDALMQICKTKWEAHELEISGLDWSAVESDFAKLVSAANNLNKKISAEEELGEDFVLGHVFFIEAVPFLHQFLASFSKKPSNFLYTQKGGWREPVEKLWRLSLAPLLKEYLSGLDNKAQKTIMSQLKEAFKPDAVN